MIQNTKGIVLNSIKYSESSVITKIYTRDFGLLSFIVNGVRSGKNASKGALLKPPNILDLVIYLRENKNLQRIKEYKCEYIYTALPFETLKSLISLFIIEVLNKSIREEEANIPLFEFLENSLHYMDLCEQINPNFHLSFMVHLSSFLGFFPTNSINIKNSLFDLQEGVFSANEPAHNYIIKNPYSNFLKQLIETPYDHLSEIKINKHDRTLLLEKLIMFFQLHIAGFGRMKSPAILQTVL